jgi:hypothetical protein
MAQAQTCSFENGNFSQGSRGWTVQTSEPGFLGVSFPDSGTDGTASLGVYTGDAVFQTSSRGCLETEINCPELPDSAEWRMGVFAWQSTWYGVKKVVLKIDIYADDALLASLTAGGSSQWQQIIRAPLPSGPHTLRFCVTTYTSCAEGCFSQVELDNFGVELVAVPVIPVTWSHIKTRAR